MFKVSFYNDNHPNRCQAIAHYARVSEAVTEAHRHGKASLTICNGSNPDQDVVLADFCRHIFSGDVFMELRQEAISHWLAKATAESLSWSEDKSRPIEQRLQYAQQAAQLPLNMMELIKEIEAEVSFCNRHPSAKTPSLAPHHNHHLGRNSRKVLP